MSHFVFNGSSRLRTVTLARDHHKTRSSIIEDAQRQRLRREEETRRTRAAKALQRAVRQWLACQRMVRQALDNVDVLVSDMTTLFASSTALASAAAEDTECEAAATDTLRARLHTACWCVSYVRRHQSHIPLNRTVTPAATGDGEDVGSAGPTARGGATAVASPVASLAELRVYQQRVLMRCGEYLYAALSAGAEPTSGASSRAPAAHWPGSLWRHLFSSLPTNDVTLLLYAFMQLLTRAAPTAGAPEAVRSPAASVQGLARLAVSAIVRHNDVFARTLGERTLPPRVGGGSTSDDSGCTPADVESSASALDQWPVVHALTVVLSLFAQDAPMLDAGTRAECAALLRPLVTALPSLPHAWVGGSGSALPPSGAFARVCWQCMCAPNSGEEHQWLTSEPLVVLVGAAGASAAATECDCRTAVDTCFAVLVAECYRRTALDNVVTPGDGVCGLRGGEVRARVLGRLVRLLPHVHQLVASAAAPTADALKWYLLAVSSLSERLCREDFFVKGILEDHYAYNTGRQLPQLPRATAAAAGTPSSSPRSQYRLPTSYLFSAEGGLQLLQLLTAEDERCERLRLQGLQRPTMEAPTEAAASPHDGSGEDDGAAPAGAAATAAPAPSTAGIAAPSTAGAALWPSSASMQQSPLEILCNVFAWPIFTFSQPQYRHYQQGTLALYAKLVRTPQLLRRLWSLYWQSCEGLRAVLPPGEALQRLCQPPVWGPHGAVPAGAASGPSLPLSLPRLPTWETHPRYPFAFYDPHASLSIFFFTLLAYYVNVCDFADELRRGGAASVMSTEESWALVLALKEIVHRSHMYGVVPDSNGEAVAHAACLLLSRLHVVNEADPFAPVAAAGLWVSVGAAAAEAAVGALSRKWDAAVQAVVEEEEEAAIEAEDVTVPHSTDAPPPHGGTATEGVVAQLRRPGDDVAFQGSTNWKQQTRYTKLLCHAPFLVPFASRTLLLSALLEETDHRWVPPSDRRVVVQRGQIFSDAFDLFHDNPLSHDMLNIRFVAEDGTLEAGYGRGVYRECIVSVCKEGFAAEHGLFRQTPDGHVYPNSFSALATSDPQHLSKIRFLGAMVGRALRDGVLQDAPFALHFRNAILGRRSTLSHLKSFDAELYHQLMSLTRLTAAELEAIGLTFVYTVNSLGVTAEVELVPGGAQVEVTPRNCLFYVHHVADFKLNREAAEQTRAFCVGLRTIIDPNRLRLFDSNEVGKLFGGDETGQIDLADWKENTVYDNPADVGTPQVRLFWEVVESLTREQQRMLLKFVTSMSRPPLLGFRFLAPPFKVQLLAANASGADHLPSAATCFSTLKLPPYSDYASARAKIIAAIEETNTFEFS
ncbi:ubiquitin-protein ligase [Novymonas esmeraldas]|uniref:HECT-type E3 ubiquitin transferase n=1 Tax=Novymonas esmeraldas TaxID=1808958 RepID=A0AAW0EKL4_9TRYP